MKSLGKFPDPFLAEIAGQPDALRRAAAALGDQVGVLGRLEGVGDGAALVYTGMGASYAACHAPVTVLGGLGLRATMVDTAELLHFRRPTLGPGVVLVVVSQSGQTAEAVRLLQAVEPARPFVVSITNGSDNALSARADVPLDTRAGPEVGPSTLSFAATLVVGAAVTEVLAGRPVDRAVRDIQERTALAAAAAEDVLGDPQGQAERFRTWLGEREEMVLLGRGTARAASETGALVLKEAAHLAAESLEAAQFRHGPLELAGPGLAVGIVATEPVTADLDLGLADELARAGAAVLVVGMAGQSAPPPNAGQAVIIPALDRALAPAVAVIPFQLLAWRLAVDRGFDPGILTIASKVTLRE